MLDLLNELISKNVKSQINSFFRDMERLTKRAYQCLTINTQDQHHENWLLFDHKYSLGSRLSLSTLSLSVDSDTEWEMRVLRWKTTEKASGGSRPSDNRGPVIRGAGLKKKMFSALRASVRSKNKGWPEPSGPLPWIHHWRLRKKPVRVYFKKSSAS